MIDPKTAKYLTGLARNQIKTQLHERIHQSIRDAAIEGKDYCTITLNDAQEGVFATEILRETDYKWRLGKLRFVYISWE